jgi:hypothetical protein
MPPEAIDVRPLTERDAIIPDVPMAVAVPVDDSNLVEASATIIQ